MLEVVEVVEEAEEVEVVEDVAVAEAIRIIGRIQLSYLQANLQVYKRLERMIVYSAIRRATSKRTAMHIRGPKNLYLKSLKR